MNTKILLVLLVVALAAVEGEFFLLECFGML
jgi:hypothetical protein